MTDRMILPKEVEREMVTAWEVKRRGIFLAIIFLIVTLLAAYEVEAQPWGQPRRGRERPEPSAQPADESRGLAAAFGPLADLRRIKNHYAQSGPAPGAGAGTRPAGSRPGWRRFGGRLRRFGRRARRWWCRHPGRRGRGRRWGGRGGRGRRWRGRGWGGRGWGGRGWGGRGGRGRGWGGRGWGGRGGRGWRGRRWGGRRWGGRGFWLLEVPMDTLKKRFDLDEKQAKALDKARKAFIAFRSEQRIKREKLHRQFVEERMKAKPDPKKLKKLRDRIAESWTTCRKKRIDLMSEIRKILPPPLRWAPRAK